MVYRKLHKEEENLLRFLIEKASSTIKVENWDDFKVQPMSDEGMGSLLLFPKGEINVKRIFGKTISELEFNDDDGVIVSVELNVDKNGELFELDIWKVDFSPVHRIPQMI